MKIQYASDLHLEFARNREWLKENQWKIEGDILILAGDVLIMNDGFSLPFLDFFSTNYEQVYMIPGNHEYYKDYDVAPTLSNFSLEVRPNIHYLNNYTTTIDNTKIIFTTLWSQINGNPDSYEKRVADFNHIFFKDERLTVPGFNQCHEACLLFLKSELKNHDGPTIVVTHHLPSPRCSSKWLADHELSEAFMVDLTDLVESSGADYWIYGHSHFNVDDFSIGKTKLLTNQLGYIHRNQQFGFSFSRSIEI